MARTRGTRVDMSEAIKGLQKLAGHRETIARHMGVAMGQEVRDEAKIRAPVLDPSEQGADKQRPGLLRDAIYVAYDERRNMLNPATYRYVVSWNSSKAPHGHLVEFGHWMPYQYAYNHEFGYWTLKPLREQTKGPFWVRSQPFLAPAFDSKLGQLARTAQKAGEARFVELMK